VSLKEFVLTMFSFQAGVLIGIVVLLSRARERLTKLEEWQRLTEKRLNGKE
jgi:hypothetical protein